MMAFTLGMLAGAGAVVLGTAIYAVCRMSQIDQYRPGRVDFTGVPVGLLEKFFEGEKENYDS